MATYDAQDRILTFGARTYTHIAHGDVQSWTESGATTTLTYDVQGNLRAVTLPSSTVVEYVVDGRNRRIGRKVNGVVTHGWLYQGQLRPVAELDAAGNIVSRFAYGARSVAPEYMIRGGVTYRLITDQLGSVRLVVNNSSGAIAQRIDYDAWGQITADTNGGFQPFAYAGGLYDPLTGLARFGARDFDAMTGRWLAKDPIAFEARDGNLLAYSLNDPINNIDPTGLMCFDLAQFAQQIEAERFDLGATAASLGLALGIGTMPKTAAELRGLGPKAKLNPTTSQLSRWSSRIGGRSLRELGRTAGGVALGTAATALLVFEGFYDWGVIGKAAWDATTLSDCGCK